MNSQPSGNPGRAKNNLARTVANLVVHLIFSTKGRQALITPHIRSDLFGYLGGIVREMHAKAIIVGGTDDHVHMLIQIRPAQSMADIARTIKANSSRWVREKLNARFSWQTGYGAFSVSESSVPEVCRSRFFNRNSWRS